MPTVETVESDRLLVIAGQRPTVAHHRMPTEPGDPRSHDIDHLVSEEAFHTTGKAEGNRGHNGFFAFGEV